MNKLTENIIEMSMYFALLLDKGELKEDVSISVSVREQFKEKVTDWAQEFEDMYIEEGDYADKIEIFLLHKLKVEHWIEEEDAEDDLVEFGYTGGNMERLTYLDAVYRFAIENRQVYLLYPDNTEAEADSLDAIFKHKKIGGMFGYESAYMDIEFVMNDRSYEDGWAESYLIKARATEKAKDIIVNLQKAANKIFTENNLPCGDDGIQKIIAAYRKENPGIIKSYEICYMPSICYGGNEYSLS